MALRARGIASRLALGTAALLLFLSLWIVVPAPTMALLPLAVGAPEVSPLLLAVSLTLVVATLRRRNGAVEATTACLGAAAALLSAIPLAQLPSAVRRFDAAMQEAGLRLDADAGPRHRMRRRPFIAADLLRGIGGDIGDAHVVRGVEFAAPGGRPLTLDIYTPAGGGPAPVLIQIHGGAWQRGAPADDGAFALYIASRGYAVFSIDYRHAPSFRWPSQLEDVRGALAWVRAHAAEHGGDPGRMAIVGRSAGAQLALTAAFLDDTPGVAAVVGYYGPTDLAEGWRVPPTPDPLDVRSVLEAYLGGTPAQLPAVYRAASPVMHVHAMTPATLLLHGTRDHIVDPRFGRELHQRLRAAGGRVVLLEIPWAEHAFDALPGGISGQLSLYYVERFLASTLGRPRGASLGPRP